MIGPFAGVEQRNISTVCQHLALVAIDGATDEVAATLAPDFRLHLGGVDTDGTGYLALIEANHAAHGTRPPLDVQSAVGTGHSGWARLEPVCLAHFRIGDDKISELWIATDWRDWLLDPAVC